MSKRNRRAGTDFERKIARLLRESGLFPDVVTSRSESRSRDNQGIDLVNKDESVNGRLPYNIQCKSMARIPRYTDILDKLPDNDGIINVVFHEFVQASKTRRFMVKGTYAILNLEDFMQLLQDRHVRKNKPGQSTNPATGV